MDQVILISMCSVTVATIVISSLLYRSQRELFLELMKDLRQQISDKDLMIAGLINQTKFGQPLITASMTEDNGSEQYDAHRPDDIAAALEHVQRQVNLGN